MLYDYNGSRLAPYPTIKGDGTTDDTSALQSLVDSEKSLHLPANLTIKLTSSITIDINKLKLFDGGNSTFLVSGDFPAFTISGTLTSSMTANPSTLNTQIMQSEAEFKLTNCKIRGSSATSGTGVSITGSFKATIDKCYIYNLKNGVVISGQNRDLIISHNSIYGCSQYGIYIDDTVDLHQCNIIGNLISYCYYCIYMNDPVQIANIQITGNDIEISTYPASGQTNFRAIYIYSAGTKSGQLSEIEICGNTIQGHTESTSIIEIIGGSNRYVALVSLVGNHISNCTGNIVLLTKVNTMACTGNTFKDGGYLYAITNCKNIAITGEAASNVTGVSTTAGTNTNIVAEHNAVA